MRKIVKSPIPHKGVRYLKYRNENDLHYAEAPSGQHHFSFPCCLAAKAQLWARRFFARFRQSAHIKVRPSKNTMKGMKNSLQRSHIS